MFLIAWGAISLIDAWASDIEESLGDEGEIKLEWCRKIGSKTRDRLSRIISTEKAWLEFGRRIDFHLSESAIKSLSPDLYEILEKADSGILENWNTFLQSTGQSLRTKRWFWQLLCQRIMPTSGCLGYGECELKLSIMKSHWIVRIRW